MQSQQKQQLRSHACKLPYNFEKKKLKITNSKYGTKYFIWKDELDEVDCQ